ncbi:tyrosinase-like protein [Thermothelomyces thermophilus ATCC 42464]|uniref:Tyrosinase-like protein n=1 Tax=Thermothelomyces thermophilus (strain ATCC 42464 / BCRC 31852 / DSM 1799) TaxID=573729 RepID=G2QH67_THET4|nr:tyrosinase-like protein [Thermothelomyces thermophilus ATCC 42464]AEO58727.1 tyrosinase-like protein [Thermothelomyces thermophilus ATCC 42464]
MTGNDEGGGSSSSSSSGSGRGPDNNRVSVNNYSNKTKPAYPPAYVPHASSCGKPKVRVEWKKLKESEKFAYLGAVKCLMDTKPVGVWSKATSIWDEMAWAHNEAKWNIHETDNFLPWHRYYIYMLETLLSKHCSYRGPIPWWRETDDTGNLAGANLFSPNYFGSLPPRTEDGKTTCITDGWFANTTVLLGPGAPTCLARGEDKRIAAEVTTAALDLCQGDRDTKYERHRRCVEATIHSSTHRAVGGAMESISASPSDPVFYLHHGFVDWQWARWQNVESSRKTTISGCSEPSPVPGKCVELTLDTVLKGYGLIPDMKVRDVLDIENGILCYTYDEF